MADEEEVAEAPPAEEHKSDGLSSVQRALIQFDGDWKKARAQAVAECKERYSTPEAKAEIAKMSKSEKQDLAVDLMMAGMNRFHVEKLLGLYCGQIAKWIYGEMATMTQKLHEGASRKALIEFPETIHRLSDLRHHPNAETSRKASLDMARLAGRGIDAPAPQSLTVNMNGQNNQFNLSTRELEENILKLADQLGPEAVQLAKGELGAKPVGFERGRAAQNGGAAREADLGAPPAA